MVRRALLGAGAVAAVAVAVALAVWLRDEVGAVLEQDQGSGLNRLFWRYGAQSDQPVFPTKNWWAKGLRKKWKEFKAEFDAFERFANARNSTSTAPHFHKHQGWTHLVLLRNGVVDFALAAHFPALTNEVLRWGSPVNHAEISVLEPRGSLRTHYGEYKGILRYHLGLEVPPWEEVADADMDADLSTKWGTSEPFPDDIRIQAYRSGKPEELTAVPSAYLAVFGYRNGSRELTGVHAPKASAVDSVAVLRWEDGEDILFDDNFLHYVANHAKTRRVVLFCNVLRGDLPFWLNALNRFLLWYIVPVLSSCGLLPGDSVFGQGLGQLEELGLAPAAAGDPAPWTGWGWQVPGPATAYVRAPWFGWPAWFGRPVGLAPWFAGEIFLVAHLMVFPLGIFFLIIYVNRDMFIEGYYEMNPDGWWD